MQTIEEPTIFNKKLFIRDKNRRYALVAGLSQMCLLISTIGIAGSSRYIGLIILIASLITALAALIIASISPIPPSPRDFNSSIYRISIDDLTRELYELGFDMNAKLGNTLRIMERIEF